MGRLGFCGDTHLACHRRWGGEFVAGLNARVREQLAVLDDAVNALGAAGCGTIIHLGDLFDTPRPEPQVIAAAQVALDNDQAIPVIVLAGNHDISSDVRGDNALAPLREHGSIIVVDEPQVLEVQDGVRVALLPFRRDTDQLLDWLRTVKADVVVAHAGIVCADTPPYLFGAADAAHQDEWAKAIAPTGAKLLVSGHWHRYRDAEVGGVSLVQLGMLAPRDFRDDGFDGYGNLLVSDMDTAEAELINVDGPRFVKVHSAGELHALAFKVRGARTYVLAEVPAGQMVQAQAVAEKMDPAAFAVEVVPDAGEAQAASRSASAAVRAADTLGQALAEFVEAMPLSDGVDRAEVLKRARGYLEGVSR